MSKSIKSIQNAILLAQKELLKINGIRVTEITDKYERHEELHTIQAIAELDSALVELQKLKCITS